MSCRTTAREDDSVQHGLVTAEDMSILVYTARTAPAPANPCPALLPFGHLGGQSIAYVHKKDRVLQLATGWARKQQYCEVNELKLAVCTHLPRVRTVQAFGQ